MSLETKNTTIEQFIAFAQQNQHQRWELIDGMITEVSPSSRINTIIAGLIIHYLNAFVVPRKLDYVTVPDGGYELGANIVRQPDAAFIARTRINSLDGMTFSSAPDLAVEVISPGETPATSAKRSTNTCLPGQVRCGWSIPMIG